MAQKKKHVCRFKTLKKVNGVREIVQCRGCGKREYNKPAPHVPIIKP